MIEDKVAEYTTLSSWIKGKKIDEGIIDFKNGIENDLKQLSKLLGTDLVIMAIKPLEK